MSVPLRFLSLVTAITIVLFSSSNDSIKSIIDVDGSRGGEDCVNFIRSEKIIKVVCKFTNLTEVYNELDDRDVLVKESPGVWIINGNILINEDSTLYINSSDTSWLKINSTAGEAHYVEVRGNMFVDSVKITGWDTKYNGFAKTSENGKMPRSYIKVVGGNVSSAKAESAAGGRGGGG